MSNQDNPGQGGSQTHRVKLVLVGEYGAGKTSILKRFVTGRFEEGSPETIGVSFTTKAISVGNQIIKVDIWDTAGGERFRSLSPIYYRGTHAIMVVYDITSADSYKKALDWIQEVRQHCDSEMVMVLVGNKVDLAETSRAVLTEDTSSYASENEMIFAETSAKTGMGIEDVFLKIVQRLDKRIEQGEMLEGKKDAVRVKLDEGIERKGNCCAASF